MAVLSMVGWSVALKHFALASVLAATAAPAPAPAAPSTTPTNTVVCAEAPTPIFNVLKPSGPALYTTSADEIASAKSDYGFTIDQGTAFYAATAKSASMDLAVHRLYNSTTGDFAWYAKPAEIKAATSSGYTDDGKVYFYASSTDSSCRVPVVRFSKAGLHRFAVTAADQGALVAAGWTNQGTAFYAGPVTAPVGSTPPTSPPATPTPPPSTPTSPTTPAPVSTTPPTPGSVAVGAARYAIPAGATFVSPSGADSNPGTLASPVRTIGQAIAKAPAGGTVVVRAGTYHENVAIYKQLTIQNYPGEAVWMDGSTPLTGWTKSAAGWQITGWTPRFDASPTYTQGAPDNTAADWNFINPSYPMAAHPDQVFVNGVQLTQAASLGKVVPGSFYLNESTGTITIGSDPTGKTVAATDLPKAISVRASGTVLRGFGVRRYATSVPTMGAITLEKDTATMQNMVVSDIATQGVFLTGNGTVLDHVSVSNCGLLGIQGNMANNVTVSGSLATNNNMEHFNLAPVSGGLKFSKVRTFSIKDSDFSANLGPGLWVDESDYDGTITNNTFNHNAGNGLALEISAKMKVVNNKMIGNAADGVKVNNTSDVQIWNNTIASNGNRGLNLVQDTRRNNDINNSARDKRMPFPDPTMPWTLGPVLVQNNVVSETGGNCLLCVEDYSRQNSAEQMHITANNNVYGRVNASAPTWLVVWSRANTNVDPYVFNTLDAYRSTTGQEASGQEVKASLVDAQGKPTAALTALGTSKAAALPADIAALMGQAVGVKTFGSTS